MLINTQIRVAVELGPVLPQLVRDLHLDRRLLYDSTSHREDTSGAREQKDGRAKRW